MYKMNLCLGGFGAVSHIHAAKRAKSHADHT